MLNRWTILNVKSRLDRRIIGLTLAHNLHVPTEKIEIWEAKDAKEMGISDLPTLLDAIAEDGFPEFRERPCFDDKELGKTCHLWNVCRFLRHLIEINETHMFIHDGVKLGWSNFKPTYDWWEGVVQRLEGISKKTCFKALLTGHRYPEYTTPANPILPGSMLSYGILTTDNFARIYSPAGAEFVLERYLKNPVGHTNDVLRAYKHEEDFFKTNGFFSTIGSIFTDLPSDWLGANTHTGLRSYVGEYNRLVPRDIIPETWIT